MSPMILIRNVVNLWPRHQASWLTEIFSSPQEEKCPCLYLYIHTCWSHGPRKAIISTAHVGRAEANTRGGQLSLTLAAQPYMDSALGP